LGKYPCPFRYVMSRPKVGAGCWDLQSAKLNI